jgi:hypothetical protein
MRASAEKQLGCSIEKAGFGLKHMNPGYPRLELGYKVVAVFNEHKVQQGMPGITLDRLISMMEVLTNLENQFQFKAPSRLMIDARAALANPDYILSNLEPMGEPHTDRMVFNPNYLETPYSNQSRLTSTPSV